MACSDCNAKCEHCYISYTGNFTGDELFKLCNDLKEKHKIIINDTFGRDVANCNSEFRCIVELMK